MAADVSLLHTIVLVLVAIIAIPFAMMLLMHPILFGFGWGMHGGGWGLLGALMLVVPLLVVLGVGYLLYGATVGQSSAHDQAAIRELERAYARGDVSTDEFEKRRETLRESH